jgi:hypothetical protein
VSHRRGGVFKEIFNRELNRHSCSHSPGEEIMNRATTAMGPDYIQTATLAEIPEITATLILRMETLQRGGTEEQKGKLSEATALMAEHLNKNTPQ